MITGKRKNIAVFCICGLGDLICLLPGIISLERSLPETKITLIVNEKPVLEFLSILDRKYYLIDLSEWENSHFMRKIYYIWQIRRQYFDVVFSRAQPQTYKVPLLVWITRAKLKIGGDNEKLLFIYDKLCAINHNETHRMDIFLKLVSIFIGKEIRFDSWEKLNLQFRLGLEQRNRTQWMNLKIGKRNVVISPGSDTKIHGNWSPPLKRWSLGHYRELVKLLIMEDIQVYIVGGTGEMEEASTIASEFDINDGVYNICGKTSISDLIILVQDSSAVITHDSGVAHLAAMLSKPLLAIFGPTSPLLFGPIGKNIHLLWGQKECRGCYPEPTCGKYYCEVMMSITPEQVMEKLFNVILPVS